MKPTLLIISATIRRDLHRPFRRFTRFHVVHAYMDAAYGDMEQSELTGTRQFRSMSELRELLDEVNPDLVQAPEPVASRAMLKAAWEVWRWHRRTGRPYFFPMFENLPLNHKFGPIAGWVMGRILQRFARDASWVYVLNGGARRTLHEILRPPDSAADESRSAQDDVSRRIIRANWGNWGLDLTEFKPSKDPIKTRANHPVVLFVGRLSQAKGVDTLLNAFTQVRAAAPAAELWLVGPIELDVGNEPLIERAKQTNSVKLLGAKKQRELPVLFQHSWVTVLLSRTTTRWTEQVGMVNLQSLACGTPVVTADSGSIREYLEPVRYESGGRSNELDRTSYLVPHTSIHDTGHGALLVPENDPEAATKAILEILQNPERREQLGEAGVAWVQRSFDEAVNVPTLEAETFRRYRSAIDH